MKHSRKAPKSKQRGLLMNPYRFGTVAPGPTEVDPEYARVVMLHHFNGPDGGTTFTDSSQFAKTWLVSGNAQIDTAQSVFGGTSAVFDGAGDRIYTANFPELFLGTRDFVIEGRARFTGAAGTQYLMGQAAASGLNTTLSVGINRDASNRLVAFCCNGATVIGSCTSAAQAVDTWFAWAYSRVGSTFRLSINGVSVATASSGLTVNDSVSSFAIGCLGDFNGAYFNGWQDEIRLTIGFSRYNYPYTVRTSAFPEGDNGDFYYDYVSLLLQGEGADAATAITDFKDSSFASRLPSSIAGSARISTTQKRYGASSIRLNQSGLTTDWVEYVYGSWLDFGTGDFTIECSVYLTAYSASYVGAYGACLLATYKAGAGGPVGWGFRVDGTASAYNQINFYTGTTTLLFNTAAPLALNTWHDICICRVGGNFRAFVNGVQEGTTTANADNCSTNQGTVRPLRIGRLNEETYKFPLQGYIDAVRITKGIGRYTAAYTPAAFAPDGIGDEPNYASVALLANFDGTSGATAAVDSGPVGHTFTAVGSVSLNSTVSRNGPTASLHNGTNASWSLPDHASLNPGAGDFTIEASVYITAGSNRAIIQKGGTWPTSGAASYVLYWDGTNLLWYVSSNGTTFDLLGGLRSKASVVVNTWYDVSLSRIGDNWYAAANGVIDQTAVAAGTVYSDAVGLRIGASVANTLFFAGYIDKVRITKGVGRYNSNYVVPNFLNA